MFRTKCIPVKIVGGSDVPAATPFWSSTEYLLCFERKLLIASLICIGLQPSGSYIRSRHLPILLCVSSALSTAHGRIIRRPVRISRTTLAIGAPRPNGFAWHAGHRCVRVSIGKDLAAWLEETATRTGVAQGQIVREQLGKAKANRGNRPFKRLAGAVSGPRTLSRRRGFSAS